MGIIAWIVLGAIAGWITNLIMGGGEGVIATIILGIIGAVVGGWLAGTVLGIADVTGINITSIIVAVVGAVIVVAIYRAVIGRRGASTV
ncbi:MAG TPA: GlsB/YeaQ/YmgE family stress response membrane protein [Candidatus Limnocylindrales bacterium]